MISAVPDSSAKSLIVSLHDAHPGSHAAIAEHEKGDGHATALNSTLHMESNALFYAL
jgi:hypothetical protein